jgi:outer membrane protein assembly factor BamB
MLLFAVPTADAQWPQWGGPNRNFSADAQGLAPQWPEAGPKKLWSRPLGEGYTSITVDDGKLFTMYRKGGDEFVVCLDAATGDTKWEHKYNAPIPEGMEKQFGLGPNATPSIAGGKIYALGVSGILHCLDEATGKVVWSHDLLKEYSAATPHFGFASSPLVYKDRLIVAAGGKDSGLLAFKLDDGSLLWKKYDFGGEEKGDVYSSPIVINVDGEDQIALLAGREVMGLDPATGEQKWSHPHINQWNTNICTPIWGDDHVLYVSSGGEAGSRGLKLRRDGGTTKVEEVWTARKMAVGQGNAVRSGKYVYASSGDGPAFITALNAADGKIAWRERGFAKATMVYGDGKLIILDEDGILALATPTPEALTVHTKLQLLKKPAWTAPTLVGKTLYVRDKETIMALDLG